MNVKRLVWDYYIPYVHQRNTVMLICWISNSLTSSVLAEQLHSYGCRFSIFFFYQYGICSAKKQKTRLVSILRCWCQITDIRDTSDLWQCSMIILPAILNCVKLNSLGTPVKPMSLYMHMHMLQPTLIEACDRWQLTPNQILATSNFSFIWKIHFIFVAFYGNSFYILRRGWRCCVPSVEACLYISLHGVYGEDEIRCLV